MRWAARNLRAAAREVGYEPVRRLEVAEAVPGFYDAERDGAVASAA